MAQHSQSRISNSMLCVATILFAGALWMTYTQEIHPRWQMYLARDWTKTACVIEASQVRQHYESAGHGLQDLIYTVFVSYSYHVNGHQYGSERYDFTAGESGPQEWVTATVAQYHPKQETFCYVDPLDSTQAVLSPTVKFYNGGILPVFLILSGAVFIILFYLRYRNS